MGFSLLGCSGESLDRDFAQPPLTRFINLKEPHHRNEQAPSSLPAPQSFDRLSLGLDRWAYLRTLIGRDNPSRVLAPARSRTFGRNIPQAMGLPHIVSGIAADDPMFLEEPLRLTGVAGIG